MRTDILTILLCVIGGIFISVLFLQLVSPQSNISFTFVEDCTSNKDLNSCRQDLKTCESERSSWSFEHWFSFFMLVFQFSFLFGIMIFYIRQIKISECEDEILKLNSEVRERDNKIFLLQKKNKEV